MRATHAATVDNPMCGDVVTVQLVVEHERIVELVHDGHGCALSVAAASVLADRLIGIAVDDARALLATFEAMVGSEPGRPDRAETLGALAAFAGVREFRSRRTCVTLATRAVNLALG